MKKALLALALLGASSTAMADSLVFGGATIGDSEYKGKSSESYSVYAGTGLLPILGIEAGITHIGEFDVDGTETTLDTYYAALRPSIDLGPLQLYAKGGFHKWEAEVDGGSDDDGYDMMYGIGAEYYIFGPISVGASYTNYTVDDENVDTYSLSAIFHFL